VPSVQEAGLASGPILTGTKHVASIGSPSLLLQLVVSNVLPERHQPPYGSNLCSGSRNNLSVQSDTQLQILLNRTLDTRLKMFIGKILTVCIILFLNTFVTFKSLNSNYLLHGAESFLRS